MSPTELDYLHLRDIMANPWQPIHPFTGAKFEAIGWFKCTNPGAGFLVTRGYALTDDGLAALRAGSPRERAE
jgi:hypothetical protein